MKAKGRLREGNDTPRAARKTSATAPIFDDIPYAPPSTHREVR